MKFDPAADKVEAWAQDWRWSGDNQQDESIVEQALDHPFVPRERDGRFLEAAE